MNKGMLLAMLLLLPAGAARAQFAWSNDLEASLREARDRDAPVLAFFWDHR